MLLFYIRHGDPIYNPDSLTELGEKQADALVDRLMGANVSDVFVSSSNRAQQTARPFCNRAKLVPKVLDWANEGYSWDEFAINAEGRYDWAYRYPFIRKLFREPKIIALGDKWATASEFSEYKLAQGVERINRSADEFLLSLGLLHDRQNKCYYKTKDFSEKNVAFFAHSGTGMALLSSVLDIPYPIFANHFMELGHSSVTVVDFNENDTEIIPRVVEYSNDSHLYKANLKPFHYYKDF